MPQRFLRPGITNSARWNSVSWKAQNLYVRLLTRVDDYGRHDGRVSVIWANCYAVWNDVNPDQIMELQQVAQMLQELINKELIEVYEVEDKKVVQITQWQERIRPGVKKWWPDKPEKKPDDVKLQQLPQKLQQDSRDLQRSPSPPTPSSPPTPRVSSPVDELRQKLNAIYRRPETDRWTYAEECSLAEVARREEFLSELEHILRYRQTLQDRKRFFPQKLGNLLADWTGTLDKARVQCPIKKPNPTPAVKPSRPEVTREEIQSSIDWLTEHEPSSPNIAMYQKRLAEMTK